MYRCGEATVELGVGVAAPPTWTRTDFTGSSRAGRLGEPLVLHCQASGRPDPSTLWLRDGAAVNLTGGRVVAESNTLTFPSLLPRDAGTYSCTKRNVAGSLYGEVEVEAMVRKGGPAPWLAALLASLLLGLLVLTATSIALHRKVLLGTNVLCCITS